MDSDGIPLAFNINPGNTNEQVTLRPITTQSVKMLKQFLKEWALAETGWFLPGSDKTYNISSLDEEKDYNKIFYKERWEIEECFRIMKSEFKARPVYLQRPDRIKAHFMTCFIPTYTRTDLTDALHETFGFRTDYQIVTNTQMKKIFRTTKK